MIFLDLYWLGHFGWDELFKLVTIVVSVLGIVVNCFLAVWLAKKLQKSITDNRVLKDIFIREALDLRSGYCLLVEDLKAEKFRAKSFLSRTKDLGIKNTSLRKNLGDIFQMSAEPLLSFHLDLLESVTESGEYKKKFESDGKILTTVRARRELERVFEKYYLVFTDVVIAINKQ